MRLQFYCGLVLLCLGCGHSVVKQQPQRQASSENWLMAGANPGRTSCTASEITLPLREVTHFKLSSAPAQNLFIRNGILFAPTLDGRLFVIDLAAQKVLSKKKLPGGYPATLALQGEGLVVASRYGKSTLFYHDLKKTREVWNVDAGDIAREPLLADTAIYVTAIFNHVDAYRLRDGTRLWNFFTEGQLYASPVMADSHVVVATTKGMVYALQASTGKKIWEKDLQQPLLAAPVIRDEQIYLASARDLLVALALPSGDELWRKTLGGRVYHAPAVNDSLVVVGASDGGLYAFYRREGRLKWSTRAFSVVGTSPLIAGDQVFFGALDHHVYGLSIADGEVKWRQELHGRVRTNPLIWNKRLIIACEDHDLYLFGAVDDLASN